jgi:hypothetical protein
VLPWGVVRESFYGDCSEEVALSAWRQLRPQGTRVFTEPYPISAWPDVPSTVIIMTEDRCCGQEWPRRVAKERIGADGSRSRSEPRARRRRAAPTTIVATARFWSFAAG